jgi:hypothetical protein
MRNIRQNLFFAFVLNASAIPIAAGALYPAFGLLLNPMTASAAMSASSVLVITNTSASAGCGREQRPTAQILPGIVRAGGPLTNQHRDALPTTTA